MIRKVSHIVILLLLLFSTIGFTVSQHFCGGEFVSTTFLLEEEPCCNSDGCCENHTKIFQLDEEVNITSILEVPESIEIDLFLMIFVLFNRELKQETSLDLLALKEVLPPLKKQTSLAIRQSYLL